MLAIVGVFTCLLTGLRIAVLDHEYLLRWSYFLPQGELHSIHVLGATLFSLCVLSFIALKLSGNMYSLANSKTRNVSIRYHLLINILLYFIALGSVIIGEVRILADGLHGHRNAWTIRQRQIALRLHWLGRHHGDLARRGLGVEIKRFLIGEARTLGGHRRSLSRLMQN